MYYRFDGQWFRAKHGTETHNSIWYSAPVVALAPVAEESLPEFYGRLMAEDLVPPEGDIWTTEGSGDDCPAAEPLVRPNDPHPVLVYEAHARRNMLRRMAGMKTIPVPWEVWRRLKRYQGVDGQEARELANAEMPFSGRYARAM